MDEHPHEEPSDNPLDRPRISVKFEEAVAAAAMALICLITFANVVVRYLTDASFAFTEEISVFLLVVLTLVGAAGAFARNRNIRVEFFAAMTPATHPALARDRRAAADRRAVRDGRLVRRPVRRRRLEVRYDELQASAFRSGSIRCGCRCLSC